MNKAIKNISSKLSIPRIVYINESKKKKLERANQKSPMTRSSSNSSITSSKQELSTRSNVVLNSIDPIMFEPIGDYPYTFTRNNNGNTIEVLYNLDTLIDYCISSGSFIDPVTRIPFTDMELNDMDLLAKRHKLNKVSLVYYKANAKTLYKEEVFMRDALQGILCVYV